MWLILGIAIPVVWFVVITLADIFRSYISDWFAFWFLMFTYAMPWLAFLCGVLYILTRA